MTAEQLRTIWEACVTQFIQDLRAHPNVLPVVRQVFREGRALPLVVTLGVYAAAEVSEGGAEALVRTMRREAKSVVPSIRAEVGAAAKAAGEGSVAALPNEATLVEVIALAMAAAAALDAQLYFDRRAMEPCAVFCGEVRCDCQEWSPAYSAPLYPIPADVSRAERDWSDAVIRDLLTTRVLRDLTWVAHTAMFGGKSIGSAIRRRVRQTISELRERCDPASAYVYDNVCLALHRAASKARVTVWARQREEEAGIVAPPVEGQRDARQFVFEDRNVNPWALWYVTKPDADVAADALASCGVVFRAVAGSEAWRRSGFTCGLAASPATAGVMVEAIVQAVDSPMTVQTLLLTFQYDVGPEAHAIWQWARARRPGDPGDATNFGLRVRARVRQAMKWIDGGSVSFGPRADRRAKSLPEGAECAVEAERARYSVLLDALRAVEAPSIEPPQDLALLVELIDWPRARPALERAATADAASASSRLAAAVLASLRPGRPPGPWDLWALVPSLGVSATDLTDLLTGLRAAPGGRAN